MAVYIAFSEHGDHPAFGSALPNVAAVTTRLRSHCRAGFSIGDTGAATYPVPLGAVATEGWASCVFGRASINVSTARDIFNIALDAAAGPVFGIRYNNGFGDAFALRNYAAAVTVPIAIGPVATEQIIKVDFHYRIHPSTGFLRCYIDGVLRYSFSGNTVIGAASGVEAIQFQSTAQSTSATRTHYSEILVSDESTLFSKVITRPFTVFGDLAAWSGVIGDINGIGSLDTTFISETTPGDIFTMSSASIPALALGDVITRVSMFYRANFEPSSPVTRVAPLARLSGTNYIGTTQALLGTVASYAHNLDLNPATGLVWTQAQINSAQFGLQAVA